MRRQFNLPENDVEFLDSKGFLWETLLESNFRWLLINDYPIPDGFNVQRATIALNTDINYPNTQIDMAFFYPSLSKINNRIISAVSPRFIDLREFQQWSRHRTSSNPWKPGEDDISTHLGMFDLILINELSR